MKSSKLSILWVLLLGAVLPIVITVIAKIIWPDVTWVQSPFHSLLEAVGVFAGIALATILLTQQRTADTRHYIWIIAALLGMGILDGFHAGVPAGSTFVWLHGMALIVGGLLFALIWLPVNPTASTAKAIPIMAVVIALILSIFSLVFSERLPSMLVNGQFTGTATAINVIGGVLFLIAGVIFLLRIQQSKKGEDTLFAYFCLINGVVGVSFALSASWHIEWWAWHGLRLIAYFILLGYLLSLYIRSQVELKQSRDHLEETVEQRTAALTGVLKDITDAVSVLSSTSAEILAASTQVAASSVETATAVSQTTSTVEEVRQISESSSATAKAVADSAQKNTDIAQNGKKAVEGLVDIMDNIRERVESIAESVVRLSEQGQAIGDIIASVNEIADQSNLLGVNAAIEAAKAGEYGKGFGVVAQEIKGLAEQSRQATTKVRAILLDVQKGTSAAVMATEQGNKAVETGVSQSGEAGESIRVLADGVAEAAQAAVQIAASNQQQMAGIRQVTTAMENIKQGSIQIAASTKQAEMAARNLNDLAQKMRQLTEHYQTGKES
jgi:methyl-accepting chemotaxis protein